jgi:hypothetical protein
LEEERSFRKGTIALSGTWSSTRVPKNGASGTGTFASSARRACDSSRGHGTLADREGARALRVGDSSRDRLALERGALVRLLGHATPPPVPAFATQRSRSRRGRRLRDLGRGADPPREVEPLERVARVGERAVVDRRAGPSRRTAA